MERETCWITALFVQHQDHPRSYKQLLVGFSSLFFSAHLHSIEVKYSFQVKLTLHLHAKKNQTVGLFQNTRTQN